MQLAPLVLVRVYDELVGVVETFGGAVGEPLPRVELLFLLKVLLRAKAALKDLRLITALVPS